jgi:hypothetical protein
MPAYISLVWFTDQGIQAAKETTDRLVRPLKHFHRQHDQKRKMTVLKSPFIRRIMERTKNHQPIYNIYGHNKHTLLRRMRLRRDSLRIHSRTVGDV